VRIVETSVALLPHDMDHVRNTSVGSDLQIIEAVMWKACIAAVYNRLILCTVDENTSSRMWTQACNFEYAPTTLIDYDME
jgi:hypothetical protein